MFHGKFEGSPCQIVSFKEWAEEKNQEKRKDNDLVGQATRGDNHSRSRVHMYGIQNVDTNSFPLIKDVIFNK